MRKEIMKEIPEYKYFCDFCGEEITNLYSSKHCNMCGIDVCNNHSIWDDRDSGDHPTVYCMKCWEAGTEYRKKMEEAQDKADEEIDKLVSEWKGACGVK